jgi:hypothetical protein
MGKATKWKTNKATYSGGSYALELVRGTDNDGNALEVRSFGWDEEDDVLVDVDREDNAAVVAALEADAVAQIKREEDAAAAPDAGEPVILDDTVDLLA